MNFVEKYLAWHERVIKSKPKYVWQAGVLGFGVPFGLVLSIALVNSNDFANHPIWERVLCIIGMTLIGGPLTGWIWGQLMWALKPIWWRPKELQTPDTKQINSLEMRVAESEEASLQTRNQAK